MTKALMLALLSVSPLTAFAVSSEPVQETFTTSLGKVFERVEYPTSGELQGAFGVAWKAPDGTIWSAPSVDSYQNLDLDGVTTIEGIIQKSEATEACAKIGGKLPTLDQYKTVSENFQQQDMGGYTSVAEEALADYHKIFPGEGEYWTSFDPYSPGDHLNGRNAVAAAVFDYYGNNFANGMRKDRRHVYCVNK